MDVKGANGLRVRSGRGFLRGILIHRRCDSILNRIAMRIMESALHDEDNNLFDQNVVSLKERGYENSPVELSAIRCSSRDGCNVSNPF